MPLYLKDKLVSGTGAPGKSAYQAAVDAGYVGTEAAFNQVLTDIPGHISDTNNPHNVTATQVGAYSKSESDTLLQNKAPAGYGLGAAAAALPSTNLDSITYNGWYVIGSTSGLTNPPPFGWGVLHVYSRNSSNVVQEVVGADKKARRYCADGTWQPWEWVNPPILPGVEYRTTERYQGKPVYVKVIEAGFNPAGTAKTTSDKTVSASDLVRFSAVSGAWSFPSFMYGGNHTDDGNIQVAVQATSDGIYVFTWSKTRDMTSRTVIVSVYYTKD